MPSETKRNDKYFAVVWRDKHANDRLMWGTAMENKAGMRAYEGHFSTDEIDWHGLADVVGGNLEDITTTPRKVRITVELLPDAE